MARFRYSMQSILDIKMKMETQAKQDFSSARANLDVEEETLMRFVGRKSQYESEAVSLLNGTQEDGHWHLDLQAVKANREAITRMEERIEDQKIRVAAAERSVEQAREKLTEVMMERKTHETLRDKAFQEFLDDEKKRESKEVDELTSYTYGQKTKEPAIEGVMA